MSECKFCNWLENGDFPEDREDLMFFRDIDIPIKEGHLVGQIYINEQVFIGRKNGKQTLGLLVWTDDMDEVFSVDKEINFCPICGRKLKEDA